jgi:lipooligosaccharide transport system permease protein
MLVLAPFGVFATWWGPFAAYGAQVLVGMVFAALIYGWSARLKDEAGFGVLFRLGVFPLFLFSGAFFPVANLGEAGAWVARLTPLWHGVNLSRMFSVGVVDWPVAALNVAVLLALLVVGWFWSVSGLTKRLVS